MNRAEKKELLARLGEESTFWTGRLVELWDEAEAGADGPAGAWDRWTAVHEQVRAEGRPDDLAWRREALESYSTPVERAVDFLMTYVFGGWIGLLVVVAVLAGTGVIRGHDWAGGVFVFGLVVIIGAAWLASKLPDRWG